MFCARNGPARAHSPTIGGQPAGVEVGFHVLDLRRVGVVDVLLRCEGAELLARPVQLVPAHCSIATMSLRSSRLTFDSLYTVRICFCHVSSWPHDALTTLLWLEDQSTL